MSEIMMMLAIVTMLYILLPLGILILGLFVHSVRKMLDRMEEEKHE